MRLISDCYIVVDVYENLEGVSLYRVHYPRSKKTLENLDYETTAALVGDYVVTKAELKLEKGGGITRII